MLWTRRACLWAVLLPKSRQFFAAKQTYFYSHVDCGDFVIVINSDKAVLTGKKLDDKFYRYHTGYIGGLKEIPYRKMMAEKSDLAVYEAVKGMLPKNSLGRKMLKKLRVYKNAEHNHEARNPKNLNYFSEVKVAWQKRI